MDPTLSFFLDAVITLAIYVLPLCLYRYLFRQKPLSRKTGLIITIIYGIVSFFIMSLIKYLLVEKTATPAPAFVWGCVNYFILTQGKAKDISSEKVVSSKEADALSESKGNDNIEEVTNNSSDISDPEPANTSSEILIETNCENSNDYSESPATTNGQHTKHRIKLKNPKKFFHILNIVVLVVLSIAVLALSIAFPFALKKADSKGFNRGYNSAYKIADEKAYQRGYDDGYSGHDSDWYKNGYDKGFDRGYDMGYNEGHREGYDEGFEAGLEEGSK